MAQKPSKNNEHQQQTFNNYKYAQAQAQTHTHTNNNHQQQQQQQYHQQQQSCCYVNTTEFRLKFLRCELFDARKAAIRMIKYLDLMVELFGLFALHRKIKLSDFSKHELQILRAGYFQIFPFRDRSGRRVMSIVGNMGIEFDPTVRVSSCFVFVTVYCTVV